MPKLNVWKDKESVNLQVVDFDQALQVYDYRNCNVSKETVLKNILQTSKKTVIYVNNTDFAPGSASMMTDVQVLLMVSRPMRRQRIYFFMNFPQRRYL